jgi:outer membrane protein assembly factor BamB
MHGIPISFEPVRPTAVQRRPRSAVALAAVGALVLAGLPARASTWDHFHGDAANSGFADVPTLPANRASAIVPNIGTYGPGAGPVIGPDGTVYLGDEGGVLRAFHADGSFYWQRTLGESIKASPVVDADGSIYVVGIGTYLDHRVNPAVTRFTSTLYGIGGPC